MSKKATRNSDIIKRYREGSPAEKVRAADEFLSENKGLVAFVLTRKFASYRAEHYDDLMQAGMIAVLEQMPRFDPEVSQATTYFPPYILHAMNEYIARMVFGTTTHYLTQITKITRAMDELKKNGNRNPSPIDIYQATGIPVETIRTALRIRNSESSSLYTENDELLNIADEINDSPEEYCEKKFASLHLAEAVSSLPSPEADIISMRFGLNQFIAPQSFRVIGEKLDMSIDEVRKCCSDGIRHLYQKLKRLPYFTDNLRQAEYDAGEELISLMPVSAVEREIDALEQIVKEDF